MTSLRWHYPDQVQWVEDDTVFLSARLHELPNLCIFSILV